MIQHLSLILGQTLYLKFMFLEVDNIFIKFNFYRLNAIFYVKSFKRLWHQTTEYTDSTKINRPGHNIRIY